MIIAKALYYMTSEKASKLNWKRMTHDFNEASIDAFIDMQNNRQDKLSVCDMILSALKNDTQKHIHEAEIESKLLLIRKMIENGVYSPYREIERLTKENDVKDKQITELMTQLEAAKDNGDELKEEELLTKIVQQSIRLGVEVTTHVDHVLRKVYWGTNKFPKHFEWLDEYIAHPESQSSIFEAIKEQTEMLKKVANKPTTQNIYGDKNEFQGGAQLLKMAIPEGADPAEIVARIAEQQKQIEKKKENR